MRANPFYCFVAVAAIVSAFGYFVQGLPPTGSNHLPARFEMPVLGPSCPADDKVDAALAEMNTIEMKPTETTDDERKWNAAAQRLGRAFKEQVEVCNKIEVLRNRGAVYFMDQIGRVERIDEPDPKCGYCIGRYPYRWY